MLNDLSSPLALLETRRSGKPRDLAGPGPSDAQLQEMCAIACRTPDHGKIAPWRFVIVPEDARSLLAEAFAASLVERDSQATPEQVEQAREKAYRAPLLMLAIGQLESGDPDIDASERLISAGCAIQNILLTAHAIGFGAALTSGKALKSQALRTLFDLAPGEDALCFINIGTPHKRKPARQRPAVDSYVSVLANG